MGVPELLIIITLSVFPLGELIRINLAKDITLHPVDLCVFLVMVSWLIVKIKNKTHILRIENIKPVSVFILIAFCSLLVNTYWLKANELIVSALYLVRWACYAGIYFAVRDTGKQFKTIILPRILLADGLIILILGLLQLYFFPSLIPWIQYQWDKHMLRLFSVFLDPNYTGAFLVLFLIFTAYNFFEFLYKQKNKNAVIFGILSGVILIAIFLTYSRSALIMLLTSSVTFLIFMRKKRVILIILVSMILFALFASRYFYIENVNLFRANSSFERITSAHTAMQIINKNPILGVGFDTYRYALIKYKFNKINLKNTSHADSSTDNSFLFIAATTGLLGLMAFMYMWYKLLNKIFLKGRNGKNIFAVCVFSCVTGLFVDALFINSLFFAPIMLWIWILMGITDSM